MGVSFHQLRTSRRMRREPLCANSGLCRCHSHLEKSLFAPVTKVTGLGSCGSRLSWLWGEGVASARRQSSRAALPKCLRQPQHLATAKPNQCCCLRNPDPLLSQIAQYIHPIDLRTAHQNHRHRPPAPHPIRKPGRVTSLSGPTVTSLSGVYTRRSRNGIYGMSGRDCRITPA